MRNLIFLYNADLIAVTRLIFLTRRRKGTSFFETRHKGSKARRKTVEKISYKNQKAPLENTSNFPLGGLRGLTF
jgi:hypothetical protein